MYIDQPPEPEETKQELQKGVSSDGPIEAEEESMELFEEELFEDNENGDLEEEQAIDGIFIDHKWQCSEEEELYR